MDFDAETHVLATEPGHFVADVDPSWSVVRGPNGGYVAAIVLRAMAETVDDSGRAPRSFTVHYVSPAVEGAVQISTSVERSGRSMTSCSARMIQEDRLIAMAVGAFSSARPGPSLDDLRMPTVDPPEALPLRSMTEDAPPIARRWESVHAVGGLPFWESAGADEALSGGWLRLPERHIPDAFVVAAATDAWVPAIFSRVNEPIVVPTVDLTIHFRGSLPYPNASADDYLFVQFRTTVIADGFLEEDGEVWSRDGVLLAQSRQLAAVFPMA